MIKIHFLDFDKMDHFGHVGIYADLKAGKEPFVQNARTSWFSECYTLTAIFTHISTEADLPEALFLTTSGSSQTASWSRDQIRPDVTQILSPFPTAEDVSTAFLKTADEVMAEAAAETVLTEALPEVPPELVAEEDDTLEGSGVGVLPIYETHHHTDEGTIVPEGTIIGHRSIDIGDIAEVANGDIFVLASYGFTPVGSGEFEDVVITEEV